MPCDVRQIDGGTVIVCSRGRREPCCEVCGGHADTSVHTATPGGGQRATLMCDECATEYTRRMTEGE